MSLQEELRVSTAHSAEEGVPIRGRLGDGLAESKRVDLADITRQVQMVCCNGCYTPTESALLGYEPERVESGHTSHSRPAGLDRLNGCRSGAVLQDDPKVGEALVNILQSRQESLLVGASLRHDAWDLAVDVENKVVLLHGREDGVEGVEGCDASIRVCGDP